MKTLTTQNHMHQPIPVSNFDYSFKGNNQDVWSVEAGDKYPPGLS